MHMNEYTRVKRLRSEEYIGEGHIAVQRHTGASYPQHWHSYFEIEMVLEGSAEHIYNGREYSIEKADAYILTPVDFHGMEARGPLELINISFDDVSVPESMLPFLSDPEWEKVCRFSPAEYDRFLMAALLLEHECESGGPCTAQLLEYLLSCFVRREPGNRKPPVGKEQLVGLRKAIAYIELHFRENITLEQLATLSGYHPSYFSELFRKVTGQTYKERLRALRIRYAQMLLRNGFTVSEACFASGFGSLSNFSAAFREKCGLPPNEYRKGGKNVF